MESTRDPVSLNDFSASSFSSADSLPGDIGRHEDTQPDTHHNTATAPSGNSSRTIDISNLPGNKRSLSNISITSFLLGQAAGICAVLTAVLLYQSTTTLWRAPFFVTALAVFHFLEFYITASYNPLFATVSAFLLTQNGAAYNIAHTSAMLECVLGRLLLPTAYFEKTALLFGGAKGQVGLGLAAILIGQITRSLAMVQAGTNFTHTIQHQRRDDHVLVKSGIYSILRHPSYFGFFWWGLGTQLVLGNPVCFCGYTIVLWQFFSSRIKREEQTLINFFGQEYVEYRKNSWVGIPGIF